jgi:hypothetical protein
MLRLRIVRGRQKIGWDFECRFSDPTGVDVIVPLDWVLEVDPVDVEGKNVAVCTFGCLLTH